MKAGEKVRRDDRARGVEPEVLAVLFREHYPGLRRFALALTGDEHTADELAQDGFVHAWRALPRMADEPRAAAAYLRKTVTNLVRRDWRRRSLELRHRLAHPHATSDPDLAGRLALLQALRRLPPRQRACVALRYLEDRTEQETAEVLGVSAGTVKSQTHKALRRLEEILEDTR